MVGPHDSHEGARCRTSCPVQLLVALQRDQVDGLCSKSLAGTIPSAEAAPVPGTLWDRGEKLDVHAPLRPTGAGTELHALLLFANLPRLMAFMPVLHVREASL